MIRSCSRSGLFVLALVLPSSARAQAAQSDSLAQKATTILEHEVGRWASTWEWYGPDRAVVRIVEGIESVRFAVGRSVVRSQTELNGEPVSAGSRCYNPGDGKIVTGTVGPDGDPWTLREDIQTRVVRSNPHSAGNGEPVVLRWTPQRISDDEMVVTMERSADGGKTWVKRNTQTMRRLPT